MQKTEPNLAQDIDKYFTPGSDWSPFCLIKIVYPNGDIYLPNDGIILSAEDAEFEVIESITHAKTSR